MKKRKPRNNIQKQLLIICIILGLTTLVLRILSRKLQLQELGEISSYASTGFIISLIIIIGLWIVKYVNKNV